jgi:hypothetical protein
MRMKTARETLIYLFPSPFLTYLRGLCKNPPSNFGVDFHNVGCAVRTKILRWLVRGTHPTATYLKISM